MTNPITNEFALFSVLLSYPVEGTVSFANECADSLIHSFPEASSMIKQFVNAGEGQSVYDLEELYTRTFDIQGRACLDIGYLLFGEDYKRGEFLVTIQKLAKDHKVNTGVELPDHLTNMLLLLDKMNEGSRKELCEKVVMPALEKLLNNFPTQNENEISGEDLYVCNLLALKYFLNNQYQMNSLIFGGPAC